MAPTAMNTVPSGMCETCIYGAFAVGGTEGATITKAPVIEGKPFGSPVSEPDAELPPVIVGMVPVTEAEEPPVIAIVVDWIDCPVFVVAAAESVFEPVPVFEAVFAESVLAGAVDDAAASLSDFAADERLGTPPPEVVSAAMGAARSAAAMRAKNGDRENFMICVCATQPS